MQLQLTVTRARRDSIRPHNLPTMSDGRSVATDLALEFGRFRVLPRRRQLLADGVPVEIHTRAFDLLLILLEAGGLPVSKDELLSRVWSGAIVEENNLHVQISALRKALGNDRDFISTDFRRGYRLTATVRSIIAASAPMSVSAGTWEFVKGGDPLVDVLNRIAALVASSGDADKRHLGLEIVVRLLPSNNGTPDYV